MLVTPPPSLPIPTPKHRPTSGPSSRLTWTDHLVGRREPSSSASPPGVHILRARVPARLLAAEGNFQKLVWHEEVRLCGERQVLVESRGSVRFFVSASLRKYISSAHLVPCRPLAAEEVERAHAGWSTRVYVRVCDASACLPAAWFPAASDWEFADPSGSEGWLKCAQMM
jgi:hypothetical protein